MHMIKLNKIKGRTHFLISLRYREHAYHTHRTTLFYFDPKHVHMESAAPGTLSVVTLSLAVHIRLPISLFVWGFSRVVCTWKTATSINLKVASGFDFELNGRVATLLKFRYHCLTPRASE